MHIAQLIINCIHLFCTKSQFMIVSSFFFTNVRYFYRCNILPASPWHHSSVQHPQSSLLSPHQHFLSGSPHPQDAEIFQHISSARYFTFGGLVCGYYDYVGSSPSNPPTLSFWVRCDGIFQSNVSLGPKMMEATQRTDEPQHDDIVLGTTSASAVAAYLPSAKELQELHDGG